MRFLIQLGGFALIILGIYFLGKNIVFTTNVSPFFWRGIAADASILLLCSGIFTLIFAPVGSFKRVGWILIGLGILSVFFSSRAILNPTSLWEFFLAMTAFLVGYRLLSTGKVPF